MTRLIALAAFLFCQTAVAQDQPLVRWKDAQSQTAGTPTALTSCNAAAVNSSITTCGGSTGFNTDGYNLLTLYVYYDWAAGTLLQFNIQCSVDNGTTWFGVGGAALSAGTDTVTKILVSHAASADSYFTYSLGINCERVRLGNVVATGSPTSSDKVTIYGRVSASPGL